MEQGPSLFAGIAAPGARLLAVDKAPQFGPNILHFGDFFPPPGNGFGGPIMLVAR
jgi:hypothetical protein